MVQYVEWLHTRGMNDVERVGGKNASLGEMIANLSAAGVRVPGGFATTAEAYREFLAHGDLKNANRPIDSEPRRGRHVGSEPHR